MEQSQIEAELSKIDLEHKRLEIERLKLENDQLVSFLKVWETDIKPIHDIFMISISHAHNFAKSGIQNIFLLNGGALIAFPTFAQIAGVKIFDNLHHALICIFSFVLGLVFSCSSSLFAFFSCGNETQSVFSWQDEIKYDLKISRNSVESKGDLLLLRRKATDAKAAFAKKTMIYRYVAISMSVLSIIAFVVGVVFAGLVINK